MTKSNDAKVNQIAKQPGGPSPTQPYTRKGCVAAPRLGPAKPGGNPRANLNPYK